jgi:phage tail sheath protein FI
LLNDALDTAATLSPWSRARLNDAGINGIHAVHGIGVRVGGARTRSGQSTWLYISTVRVVLEFRRWIAARMSELVFEPLGPPLWDVIRTRLILRCLELQRNGALVGGDPSGAFFVKCDAETNPPAERDLGRVVAHVGLAPTIPAEFIVIRVVQDTNGSSVGGLS